VTARNATLAAVDDIVPVIDIGGYEGGAMETKLAIARRIDDACRSIGFLVAAGHGVPESLIIKAERAARAFFDLPLETKQHYVSPDPNVYRGYFALESNAVAYSLDDRDAAPDLFERFAIGRVAIESDDPYYSRTELTRRTFAPNLWPTEIDGFAATMTAYYDAMSALARKLMRLFALALNLEENWFDDKIDKHMTSFVIQNYPDQIAPPRPGQLRAGAHSDYGSLTILKTEDKPGGLEIKGGDGMWRPVKPQPGTFIINIGDLMAQWTNDRWVSTMHRVVNPPRDEAAGSRRQSLIFFHQPNYDALVECIPTCITNGRAIYPPITSGEHLLNKLRKQMSV
jgi:isopenicillin N synthase-like dioxygenase